MGARALSGATRDGATGGGAELPGFYVCSLSCRTIVYKALLTGTQLPAFFTDFRYPEYESAIAVFHQRYSTNTLPSWPLAQPFRLLAHNGEINTLWGNRNAMTMRQPMLASPVWGEKIERLREVIWKEGSDSASLDNAMELLVRSGRDPVHASMMMIPQAWEKYSDLDPAIKAFYEYHQCVLEPWDGPAALAFTDGVSPRRAWTGMVSAPAATRFGATDWWWPAPRSGWWTSIRVKWWTAARWVRARCSWWTPRRGEVIRNHDAKRESPPGARTPAGWHGYMATLVPDPARRAAGHEAEELAPPAARLRLRLRRPAAGARADGRHRRRSGLEHGRRHADPAALRRCPQSLYAYFRQRFAQVTNPPIDSLRESMVMSLRMHLAAGARRSSSGRATPGCCGSSIPVLLADEMAALRNVAGFSTVTLDAVWDATEGADGLRPALTALRRAAERAARRGASILVISDRAADERRAPIPMLLAIGAVRQHLVHTGLRARVGLVAEAGDAFDIHHFATLIGYGAEAVHPWLALATVRRPVRRGARALRREREAGSAAPAPPRRGRQFRAAAEKGLLKILSKMGISTLSSYCGAQIFEVLGLGARGHRHLLRRDGVAHRRHRLRGVAEDVLARHGAAYPEAAEPSPSPTTAGCASARKVRTMAGRRRSWWHCSRR